MKKKCFNLVVLILFVMFPCLLHAIDNPVVEPETNSSDLFPVGIKLFENMSVKKKSVDKKESQKTKARDAADSNRESLNNDTIEPDEVQPIEAGPIKKDPDRVYRARAFGFHRLPFKYDESGVRELHKGPIIFRATANLTLEKGEHRILIRTRNDATLKMDGETLTTVKALAIVSDGHNPLQDIPELVSPGIKDFAPGNTEKIITLIADGLSHTFTLETIVGRSGRRPEIGLLAVAIAGSGEDTFTLLGSDKSTVFSDEGWVDYANEEEARLIVMDRQERRTRSLNESRYWQRRHAYAKQWLDEQDTLALPPVVGKSIPVFNAVDRYIGRAIEEEAIRRVDLEAAERVAHSKGLVSFLTDIQPILNDHCLKCHGDKEKGELRLDSRQRAVLGGESEEPAFIAGHPEKSLLVELITSNDKDIFMPPNGRRLDRKDTDLLSRWIRQGAKWESADPVEIAASRHPTAAELKSTQLSPLRLTDDLAFLRRVSLDTVGVIASLEEIEAFQADTATNKRSKVIERLLSDARWADHWVPFWQDILAENPNIVKPNLNNTGAFRWWIHESFADNKPMDQFVTDLILMRGDRYIGPAGFGMATQNDVPMAAKAHILGGAFLGVQMKCARCHDAPFHSVKQEHLFNIAAMLKRKPITVPASSIAPIGKISGRQPLVKVSLKADDAVVPSWPFDQFNESPLPDKLKRDPDDPREDLAAHMTSPSNSRFAKAIVNWAWKRYFGTGLIEPANDWENADISHPDLLDFLEQELVRHDYDIKHVCRLILNSHTYQRQVLQKTDAQASALFVGHSRRRMTAEQILDSLHLATDSQIDSEELNMDQDGSRPIKQFINLGTPRRAWEFTSLSNERDRPSLTLPHAQVYVDVLETYGWNGSRQNPIYNRDHESNVLQPATLANGIISQRLTRLSDDHPLTELVMESRDVEELVDILFLKTLGRPPDKSERKTYTSLLRDGYDRRIIPEIEWSRAPKPRRYPYVTWSNHLKSESSDVKNSIARDIEAGKPPTRYLRTAWRKNLEDGLWALINSPEMIFVP